MKGIVDFVCFPQVAAESWKASWYIGTKMEKIGDELVIKFSVGKNEVEIGDLPWEMLERERKDGQREQAILLLICEVIDYFIVPLHLWITYHWIPYGKGVYCYLYSLYSILSYIPKDHSYMPLKV